MKRIFTILFLFPIFSNAQLIRENLYRETKSFSPLFGKEKGNVNISLDMTYKYPYADTAYTCTIDISERKIKLEGVTNSMNVGGTVSAIYNYGLLGAVTGLGFGSNRSYSYNDSKGIAILDFNSIDTLLNQCKLILKLSTEKSGREKTILFKTNKVLVYYDKQIVNGEFISNYYLQIDDSAFKLNYDEFKEITEDILPSIYNIWDVFNKTRTVQQRILK